MKNQILSFMLGAALRLCIAATTQTLTTTQPATPKAVVVQDFRVIFGLEKDIKKFIDQKVKEGYIVKSVSMMDDETVSKGIVVMEKY